MKRKIIRQGHNTLTITLPSDWAKRFNLNAGNEVELIDKDNGLFISTEKNNELKKAKFDLDHMDVPIIWKYLMGVYREGYDELKITFSPGMKLENPYKFFTQHKLDLKYKKQSEKRNIISVLQGFIDRFIGWEIVEHGKDYIIVRDMGETTSKQFDNSLRRVFLLLESMGNDTLEAFKTNQPSLLEEAHDIDINLDKFHDYCIRILNKNLHKDSKKTNLLFSSLYLLELIGDEFKKISHHLLMDFKNVKYDRIEGLAQATNNYLASFQDLFYKYDLDKVKKMSEFDKEIYFKVSQIYRNAKEHEKEVYHHLRSIHKYLNALVELRIEMEF